MDIDSSSNSEEPGSSNTPVAQNEETEKKSRQKRGE